jgi:hypothetical protein
MVNRDQKWPTNKPAGQCHHEPGRARRWRAQVWRWPPPDRSGKAAKSPGREPTLNSHSVRAVFPGPVPEDVVRRSHPLDPRTAT